MDDDPTQQSPFPGPPPYWASFTSTNLEHLKRLREEANIITDPTPASDLTKTLSLPPHLEHLIPPPEPSDGIVRTFGELRYKAPPLPTLPSDRLLMHSANPGPTDLKQLTRGALLAFLELTHILATNPAPNWSDKWWDLKHMLSNAHHVLELYRPWAAREQLIALLEGRVHAAKEQLGEIERLEKEVENVRGTIRADADAVKGGKENVVVGAVNGANGVNGYGGIKKEGHDGAGNGKDDRAAWQLVVDMETEES